MSKPNILITSITGSGVVGEAVMSGYLDKINLTNPGSGYTCMPNVAVDDSPEGTNGTAVLTMTEFNPIHSIELTDVFIDANKYETVPEILIDPVTTGSGATATVQLSS